MLTIPNSIPSTGSERAKNRKREGKKGEERNEEMEWKKEKPSHKGGHTCIKREDLFSSFFLPTDGSEYYYSTLCQFHCSGLIYTACNPSMCYPTLWPVLSIHPATWGQEPKLESKNAMEHASYRVVPVDEYRRGTIDSYISLSIATDTLLAVELCRYHPHRKRTRELRPKNSCTGILLTYCKAPSTLKLVSQHAHGIMVYQWQQLWVPWEAHKYRYSTQYLLSACSPIN